MKGQFTKRLYENDYGNFNFFVKFHGKKSWEPQQYSAISKSMLALNAPITTAADDKFCDIFPNFQKK